MDTITKEISDVVCTAITLGHIKKFGPKSPIQIVYEKHENAENEMSLEKPERLHKSDDDALLSLRLV